MMRADRSVSLYKKSDISDSLRHSLQKEQREQFAPSLFMKSATREFALVALNKKSNKSNLYFEKWESHFCSKKERFPRITKEQIPNPAQSWEFAHSLIAHSLIAHLLISLKSNEQLWTIRSDRSRQMSDRERFALVAHDK